MLESLGHVFGGRVGDLVSEHGREPRVIASQRLDAGVHDDLAPSRQSALAAPALACEQG